MNNYSEIRQALVDPEIAAKSQWDVAIIGAGVGGSTAAYALSRKGINVLLIEKGLSSFSKDSCSDLGVETVDPIDRLNSGKWPTKLKTITNGSISEIWAPLGCGIGGSSLLYSAALSRLETSDFIRQSIPDGREVSWPFSYDDLEPYYENAERIYSVRGTQNPISSQTPFDLLSPPPLSGVDQHFFKAFKECGLNPYRLHVGFKNVRGCDLCAGYLCHKNCKHDALQSCLIPGIKTGKLSILDQTEVVSIDADRNKVQHILCQRNKLKIKITANIYILAAGAYFSPIVLQRSKNSFWPRGINNEDDLVGRNLMFHVSEHVGIWPKGSFSTEGIRGAIALRDFYNQDGIKYGEFQSVGTSAGYGDVLYYLRTLYDKSAFRHVSFLRHFLRIPAYIGTKIFSNATVFACILQDYPYLENRVVLDSTAPSGMRVEYTIHRELEERCKSFRKMIRSRIKTNFMIPLLDGIFLNHGHPCGTCSAGNNPKTSVVDKNCRVHGISNLFITDASIMPTSGGANPSLTIAANALRVSDKLIEGLAKN